MVTFSPVRPRRIFEEISGQIASQVREGLLRAGDKLPPERELARQFGASRNAVREALRSLEESGIIELRQGSRGGAYIHDGAHAATDGAGPIPAGLSGVTLEDLLEARAWLSLMAIEIACERATERDFAALADNLDRSEAAFTAGDQTERIRRNIEFHNVLAAATGNPVIQRIVRSSVDLLPYFSQKLNRDEAEETIRSRRRILQHLRDRNASAATLELENHLQRLHKNFLVKTGTGTVAPPKRGVAPDGGGG